MLRKEIRIKELIARFYTESNENTFKRNRNYRKELQQHGRRVVDLIVDELLQRTAEGTLMINGIGSPTWHLLMVVEELAELQHASRVAKMLSWEELLIGQNRGYRILIPEILRKIGGQPEIPALEAFAESLKSVVYRDYYDGREEILIPASDYNEWDQEITGRAIIACKERS